jgi:hypothetical protein
MRTDTAPTAHKLKRKRRRCQFSLRTLLLLVPVVGIGLGWLGVDLRQLQEIKDRDQTEETLFRAGGRSNDEYRLEGRVWKWATVPTDAEVAYLQRALPNVEISH